MMSNVDKEKCVNIYLQLTSSTEFNYRSKLSVSLFGCRKIKRQEFLWKISNEYFDGR